MKARAVGASIAFLFLATCRAGDQVSAPTTSLRAWSSGSGPTVLVANATCAPGPCQVIDVRGFVAQFSVPGQSVGFLDLGSVDSSHACLQFPDSLVLTVTGPVMGGGAGSGDQTNRYVWTPADSITLQPVQNHLFVVGVPSASFVPSTSAGWRLTLPNDTVMPTPLPGGGCAP